MRQAAEAYLERHRAPGMGVAIYQSGQRVYEEAFGFANPARTEPMTPQNKQRIASASKPITATAIFLLIEQRQLRLSDRVFGRGSLLGDTFAPPSGARWLDDITVNHLLTHSSGGWSNDGADPMFQRRSLDTNALIAATLRGRPLQTPPGAAYAYSNFGYCLLGRIIERVCGQPYELFVTDRLLRPVGLRMRVGGNTLAERLPSEVQYAGSGAYEMNIRRMDSHGGWVATPTDLAAFASGVDGRGSMRVLSPGSVNAMTTPSTVNPTYARGWSVNKLGNWWHTGTLPGTTSIVVRTASGFCWAAIVNAGSGGSPMAAELDGLVWSMVRQVPRWRA